MKKVFCVFLSISLCFLFVACGNTSTIFASSEGVPDSLVLRNISLGKHMTYEINHNYEKATYIDDVELITYYSGDFGVRTKNYTYAYQYDKSSDLWSLIGTDNGLQSDVTTLNPKAYIGKSFEGRFDQADSGQYFIKVRDLDLTNKTITIDYSLEFDDGETVSKTAVTTAMGTFSDGSGFGFDINYMRSMVVMFFVTFSLDLIEGICA